MSYLRSNLARSWSVLIGVLAPLLWSHSSHCFERELAADRPDSTENPITVEPGATQVETSLWSYSQDDEGGGDFESWVFGETNIKFGLTDDTDVQFVLAPYVYETERTAGGGRTTKDGFGDIEMRLKWNLWGNDGGETSFAFFPYVKIPTGTKVSNDEWEGGLILPFATDLSENWGLGLQVQADRLYDEDAGHYWSYSHTAVLGTSITDDLGVYVEYLGVASELPYEAYFSGGFTFAINQNFQWDIGVLAGLNTAAQDLSVFQGFTWRF